MIGLLLVLWALACGPPSVVDRVDEIDAWMARGNYAYVCVGLDMRDETIKKHAAEQLARYPAEPEAADCLCDAVYDAEASTWDPIVAEALRHTRHDRAAGCLGEAAADTRVPERTALAAALGATLAPSAFEALGQLAREDDDPAVRAAAVRALQPSNDHGGFLRKVLANDPAPDLRAAAAAALSGREDGPTRTALVTAVREDADATVRRTAVETLGKPDHPTEVGAVCDALLEDDDASVRAAAAAAFAGTKDRKAGICLANKIAQPEDSGAVRVAVLEAAKTSPRKEVSAALCDEIGPWLRRYVKDKLAHEVPGFDIIEAQNHQHWEDSYRCVTKARSQRGYSCYARNYLAYWVNDLGGSATPPWCPGMPRAR